MSAMGAHGTAGTRGGGVGHGSCVARHELGSLWPLVLPDAGLGTERQDHPERGAWVSATGFGMPCPPLWSGVVLDAGKGGGRIMLDGTPTEQGR